MPGVPDLAGSRIVVTRAPEQSKDLVDSITQAGGVAVELPLVQIEPIEDASKSLAAAVLNLGADDWLVVLSPNAARLVVEQVDPRSCKLAVLASGTAAVFEAAGWAIDLRPDIISSEGLLEAFETVAIAGWVLIIQAEGGRSVLQDGLRDQGVVVERIAAYRNVLPPLDKAAVDAALAANVVVFASPSAVRRYVEHVGVLPVRAVCIGGVTAGAAVAVGFETSIATAPTVEAIVERLASS